jgi:hypothetical protein
MVVLFSCLEGVFQAVISVILQPFVIEFFERTKGLVSYSSGSQQFK